MAWGFAAALGSSALSAFSASATNKKSYKYSKRLQEHQYQLQRQLNQNAYQDTTYSMRQAGINPMVAIGNGASAGSVSGSQFQANNPELEQGISTALQAKQMKKEQQVMDSNIDLNKSNERKSTYEADLAHENSAYINEQTRQLQTFGPAKQNAEIASILQNIENGKRITDAQIENLRFDNIYKANSAISQKSNSDYLNTQTKLLNEQFTFEKANRIFKNVLDTLGIGIQGAIAIGLFKKIPGTNLIKPTEKLIKIAPQNISL